MSKNKNLIIFLSALAVLIIILVSWGIYDARTPGQYDKLAKCLTEKGAKFYGAFWCSHCNNQKDMFGKSAKYLPYIECSTPDGRGQKTECGQQGVSSYPTWEFPDGTRVSGEITPDKLAEKAGCEIN